MEPERPENEALEQAELRKRLIEETQSEREHREGRTDEASRHRGPEPEWRPPKELTRSHGGVLVRFVVFLLLLLGVYYLIREGSTAAFQPELTALSANIPEERIEPGQPIRLSVQVVNLSNVPGTAFAVAALASGQEVTSDPVEVAAYDTATLAVDLRLPIGDHVVSLVAFEAGAETDRRLEAYTGRRIWVGDREIQVDELMLPDTVLRSDTLIVDFSGTNPNEAAETVVPVLVFGDAAGELTEIDGPPVELPPGETAPMQITIVAESLSPGRYTVQLLARTPTGERLALENLAAVEVRDP